MHQSPSSTNILLPRLEAKVVSHAVAHSAEHIDGRGASLQEMVDDYECLGAAGYQHHLVTQGLEINSRLDSKIQI